MSIQTYSAATITLRSSQGDRVTLSYSVTKRDGKHLVKFDRDVKVILSAANSERYKVANVKTMFFDRAGDYSDIEFSTSDVSTKPFLVNNDIMDYTRSTAGYFIVEDEGAELQLTLRSNQAILSIPVFLACYEKPRFKKHGRYKVFASCGNIDIPLEKKSSMNTSGGETDEDSEEKIVINEEVMVDEGVTEEEGVGIRLQDVERLLAGPLDNAAREMLEHHRGELMSAQYKIADERLRSRIGDMIGRINDAIKPAPGPDPWPSQRDSIKRRIAYVRDQLEKIDDLPDSDRGDLKAMSTQLLKSSYDIKDRDSELAHEMKKTAEACDKAFKDIEDKAKRRNVWLIIGGVLLVMLMFVGGQLSQHLRNKKNMASIKNTQDEITKRAQNEARRRAQNAARSKMSRIESDVRKKSRDAVRNSINGAIKGKNITNV